MPPVAPMLAKSVSTIPASGSYEPKWDGFRSIIFRDGDEVEIGQPQRTADDPLLSRVGRGVRVRVARAVRGGRGDRAGHRRGVGLRGAAAAHPPGRLAGGVAVGDDTGQPFAQRRAALEHALCHARAPVHLTPATTDRDLALRWFDQFEGAGLDGVVAKPLEGIYEPDRRVMFKIKHERTADCVVAGYRLHKSGPDAIGSLLLGLYTDDGSLASVGVIGAFPLERRKVLFEEMQPLVTTFDEHPWAWAKQEEGVRTPRNAEGSRWQAGKDLSFVPLRPELVVEVRYDHMEGVRFRHTAQFVRWRPDRTPESCTYDRLDRPVSFAHLNDIVPGLR